MPAPRYTREELKGYIERGFAIVGEHTYGAPILRYWATPGTYRFHCGKYCSIADRVEIFLGGYHRPDWVSSYPFPAFGAWAGAPKRPHTIGRGDVRVGNDVWLGSQCVIMAGVTVGDGAVIAARAVVTKDVPPYAVVAGNPGRLIKYRFDETTIAALLRIRWWDWPDELVRENLELLLSPDLEAFIRRNDPTLAP